MFIQSKCNYSLATASFDEKSKQTQHVVGQQAAPPYAGRPLCENRTPAFSSSPEMQGGLWGTLRLGMIQLME